MRFLRRMRGAHRTLGAELNEFLVGKNVGFRPDLVQRFWEISQVWPFLRATR